MNLTTGTVLWNISAEQEFNDTYPQLIDGGYNDYGSTLIDSNTDGIPELWVTAEAIVGPNTTWPEIYTYLFAYDLLSHQHFQKLLLSNITNGTTLSAGPVLGGHFYNCTNELGILVEWSNILVNGTYIQHLALFDSQTLEIVWEPPYGPCYRYWVYDLNGDGYDDIIASWTEGWGDTPFISLYDGRNFTQLWKTKLPPIPNEANYIKPEDIDFLDLNTDGHPDLIVTGDDGGNCALDGTNGKILWIQADRPYYGGRESVVVDIDHDDVPEVITTRLEHVMIFNAITGEMEVYEHLPFYFDSTDLNVLTPPT